MINVTEHSEITQKYFPDIKICWCCGNKYDTLKNRCIPGEHFGHPCELMSKKGCKTRKIRLRNFGHCHGKVRNKSWGLKMRQLKIKKFKNMEEKFKYFDKKLKALKLKKFALNNEWKDELIEIVISDI